MHIERHAEIDPYLTLEPGAMTMTTTTATTYYITTTNTKTGEVPAPIAGHIRVEARIRKPFSQAFTVDIPLAQWIDTSDVPSSFRPLVDAALLDCASSVLHGFVTNTATRGNSNIPSDRFTLDALQQSATSARMTAAQLIGMWRNSCKYRLEIEPKLTEYKGTALLRYKANVERHEKRLAALCGRSPESVLTAADLDKLLINLAPSDEESALGVYLADRTEYVRSLLVDVDDCL